MIKWVLGVRVARQVYLDDGTWNREGDKCLPASPLRHGVVVSRSLDRDDACLVKFDDGTIRSYLDHGLNEEVANG